MSDMQPTFKRGEKVKITESDGDYAIILCSEIEADNEDYFLGQVIESNVYLLGYYEEWPKCDATIHTDPVTI